MSDEAKFSMILCSNVLPEEEAKSKSIENEVIKVLSNNSITIRPILVGESVSGARVLKLQLPSQPEHRVILEISPEEFINLSDEELIAQIQRSIQESQH